VVKGKKVFYQNEILFMEFARGAVTNHIALHRVMENRICAAESLEGAIGTTGE
jgi:hypothetical protein